ncbi:RWD domain-containing protein 4-like [Halichondria panicea]|uniref:RWD domain-containing protein 4-like n=1 Tax=Halichondria panicea TaxID=6063 RepID=UPI00312B6F1C
MACAELQEEEREVLISIYESDECFSQVDDTTYTYKVGDSGSPTSFLLQISWSDSYPGTLPDISLDAFYNKHLSQRSKEAIVAALKKEAKDMMDSAMTYTLFEFAKENGDDIAVVPLAPTQPSKASVQPVKVKKEKKEILTKSAKRRLAGRLNTDGELPRGWNWVDIVKVSLL